MAVATTNAEIPGADNAAPAPTLRQRWRAWVDRARAWSGPAFRTAALCAAIAAGVTYWAQLSFKSAWVSDFLLKNELDLDRRNILIKTTFGGAFAGAVLAGVALIVARLFRKSSQGVERVAWFIAPLGLVGFFPVVLRRKAWEGEALGLLVSTAVFVLLAEGAIFRSLRAAPRRLGEWIKKILERAPPWLKKHAALAVVLVATVVFAFAMSRYAIMRHRKFDTAIFELGLADNLMYNALSGSLLKSPLLGTSASFGSDLGVGHALFGQFLVLPLYALRPSPETLIVLQTALTGLGALPLFFFARRRLSDFTSTIVALAFLLYPPLHGATLHDVTWLPIASVAVLVAIWAADAKRWKPFWAAVAVALLVREDVAIGLAVVGVVLAFDGERSKPGLILVGVSFVYFIAIRFWLSSRLPGAAVFASLVPEGFQPTFLNALLTLFSNPGFALRRLLSIEWLTYALHLLVPLALLPVRRAGLMIALIPGIVLTLLMASYVGATRIGFHYAMYWVPYLFVAVVLALAGLQRIEQDGVLRMRAALVALGLATFVLTHQFGALGRMRSVRVGETTFDFTFMRDQAERYVRLRRMVRTIPRTESVAATNHVAPHVSTRKELYLADASAYANAKFLLFWRGDLDAFGHRDVLSSVLHGKDYGVVSVDHEFMLLEKGRDPRENQQLLTNWEL